MTISRLSLGLQVRDPKNPKGTIGYGCGINGITQALDLVPAEIKRLTQDEVREDQFFSLDDADWSQVPALGRKALEKVPIPDGRVFDIALLKPSDALDTKPLQWKVHVVAGLMGDSGSAYFDPKSGALTNLELPRSLIKPVDFLQPDNTRQLITNILEDFGPDARFGEVTADHDSAWVDVTTPKYPTELRRYDYSAAERAKLGLQPRKPLPSNSADELVPAADLKTILPLLEQLEGKALERLRIPGGAVTRLTLYRQSPFYPSNKKSLVEIRCEGNADNGRVVYDATGKEVDVVGGNPSRPVQTTGPQLRSGIFVGEAGRFTSGSGAGKDGKEESGALFDQWQAVIDADAGAEEKCSATRWGQLAEKGDVSPADISREDSREYRLAELGRIETAKKVLAFLERPSTKARMAQLKETTERHGLDQRKFFDPQFWRATIRRMTASNELKKLSEEHWDEVRESGSPKEGPNLKEWQRKYLRLEAEEQAAREERVKVVAKYQ
jgi:hypothetical protein